MTCIILVVAMIFSLSPVSGVNINAYHGNGYNIGLDGGLESDYDDMPNYEDFNYDQDDEIVDEEDECYIDLLQEELPLGNELLLTLDELTLDPVFTPIFSNEKRVLAAILAAGGIYFADAQNMYNATSKMLDAMDSNLLSIITNYANSLLFVYGTDVRRFETTVESLVPIWELAQSIFTIHDIDGRQVAKIPTVSTAYGHFHIGNHIGESVIPVICLDALHIDDMYDPPMGGIPVTNPAYISILQNMLPNNVVFRGNTYTGRVSPIFDWLDGSHIGFGLWTYRNNVRTAYLKSTWYGTITPLGFVILRASSNWGFHCKGNCGDEPRWGFYYVHLYEYANGFTRIVFSQNDGTHNYFIGGPIPYFFPTGEGAIIGHLAPENILTNISLAQAALLDAANITSTSGTVRINVSDTVRDLLNARVTDVVVPSGHITNPSYSSVKILIAILAAGGIYFDNIVCMESVVFRLYRSLDVYYRNRITYKANNIVYIDDDTRATKWEPEYL